MGNPLKPPTVLAALAIGPSLENSTRVIPAQDSVVAGTTYTLVLQDDGLWKRCTNGSAVTITIPPNSTVPLPVNSSIIFSQDGAGQVTLAAGAGVTLHSAGAKLASAAQYAVIQIFQNSANVWSVFGNLT